MHKCGACTHEIPKKARACSYCGFLAVLSPGVRKQISLRRSHNLHESIQPSEDYQTASFQAVNSQSALQQDFVERPAPAPVQMPVQTYVPAHFTSVQTMPAYPNPSIQQFHQQNYLQQAKSVCPPVAPAYQQCTCHSAALAGRQRGYDVSGLSIASLVLGIIALLSSLMPVLGVPFAVGGIICGLACKDKRTKGTSMAFAVMGIIFSILALILSLAMIVFWLVTPSFAPLPSEHFIF